MADNKKPPLSKDGEMFSSAKSFFKQKKKDMDESKVEPSEGVHQPKEKRTLGSEADPIESFLKDQSHLMHEEIKEEEATIERFLTKQGTGTMERPNSTAKNRFGTVKDTKKTLHKGKSPPRGFGKMSEKDKERAFLDIYDENLKLKEQQNDLDKRMRIIQGRMRLLDNDFETAKELADLTGAPVPTTKTRNVASAHPTRKAEESHPEMDRMAEENRRLKEKLKALGSAGPASHPVGKPSGGHGLKKLHPTTMGMSNLPEASTDKSKADLLKLIDMLANKVKKSEQEVKLLHEQLQGGKGDFRASVVHKEMHEKSVKISLLEEKYQRLQNSFEKEKALLEKTKELLERANTELNEARLQITNQQTEVHMLKLASDTNKDILKQLDEAKNEKRLLEQRVTSLCESPFIKDASENLQATTKLHQLEIKMSDLNVKLRAQEKELDKVNSELKDVIHKKDEAVKERNEAKEEKVKLQTILQERERKAMVVDEHMKLFNLNDEKEQDRLLKALGDLKWKGEQPSWMKLDFIERPKDLDLNDKQALIREIDILRLEKGELAAQLEKLQTLLHTHMEMEKDRAIIHDREIQQKDVMLRMANQKNDELAKMIDLARRAGIGSDALGDAPKYDGDIGDFSIMPGEDELLPGENLLDLVVHLANFDPAVVSKILNKDVKTLFTLITVDFYDYDLNTSSIVEGFRTNYNTQMAFKVFVDEYFLHYMQNNCIKIEVYASVGVDSLKIGTAKVFMQELLDQSGGVVSKVVSNNATIQGEGSDEIVGSLAFKLRFRFPISETVKLLKDRKSYMPKAALTSALKNDATMLAAGQKRKLIVNIDRASGLRSTMSTFVTYQVPGEMDAFTSTVAGGNPNYEYYQAHEIKFDDDMKQFIVSNALDIVMFDESIPVSSAPGGDKNKRMQDVVGRGRLKLAGLLENQVVEDNVTIFNLQNQKVAALHVKVYWYDTDLRHHAQQSREESLITKNWEEDFTKRIANALKNKGLGLYPAFNIFDNNNDGVISFDEFKNTVKHTLGVETNDKELDLYWSRLGRVSSTWSRNEFDNKFLTHIGENGHQGHHQAGLAGGIGSITQMLDRNTQALGAGGLNIAGLSQFNQVDMILRVISERINDHMKRTHKMLLEVYDEFDSNQNGVLDRREFPFILNSLGVNISPSDQDILFNYLDKDRSNTINLKEFFDGMDAYLTQPPTPSTRRASIAQFNPNDFLRQKVANPLTTYLANNSTNLKTLFKQLDKNNDRKLSIIELHALFKRISANVTPKETEALMKQFASDTRGHIKMDEFQNLIESCTSSGVSSPGHQSRRISAVSPDRRMSSRGMGLSLNVSMNDPVDHTLTDLADFVIKGNLTIESLFNQMDKNRDGAISLTELRDFLADRFKNILNKEDGAHIMEYFDKNADKVINLHEFLTKLKPIIFEREANLTRISRVESGHLLDREGFDWAVADLLPKIRHIVGKNYNLLKKSFDIYKMWEKKGTYVKREDFQKVLLDLKIGFTPSDVVNMVNEHMLEADASGNVNYMNFLEVGSSKNPAASKLDQSIMSDKSHSSRLVTDVFQKIANVCKRTNTSFKKAFAAFDSNNNGKISTKEMREAFKQMKLDLNESDIKEILRVVDDKGDGEIDYHKFEQLLKL